MPADLVWFPMEDFDLILGMEWLAQHDAIIHCKEHQLSASKLGMERWLITRDHGDQRKRADSTNWVARPST